LVEKDRTLQGDIRERLRRATDLEDFANGHYPEVDDGVDALESGTFGEEQSVPLDNGV
jgi:hypothetical protein